MPRPKRVRRVCAAPIYSEFSPEGEGRLDTVILTVDEYEVLRIVDYEKKTHEECALLMDIARTTVTEIYESARYKVADAIINGKRLLIAGGNYRFCDGEISDQCGRLCHKRFL